MASFILRQVPPHWCMELRQCMEDGLGTLPGTWAWGSAWNMGLGQCTEHGLGTLHVTWAWDSA